MTQATATTSAALLSDLDDLGPDALSPAGDALYRLTKRLADVVISLSLLAALSPLMLLTALAIKLTSHGPVFFSQMRAGLDGKPFRMFKFRSMRVGAEGDREFLSHLNRQNGPVFKAPEDPRLIAIGRFLRRSSIDELPQLVNVLLGQMSLVGPRPLWVEEARQTRGAARMRTLVRPGLTCLWQISGRSELPYESWVVLDLFYIHRRSLSLDALIFLQTIPAVLSGHGAY